MTIGDDEFEAFPFWYPQSTGPEGIEGPLVIMTKDTPAGDLSGCIAFVSVKDSGLAIYFKGVNSFAGQAAKAGAKGLIVSVGSASAEIAAINAREPYHQKPLPLPAVIVAGRDQKKLGVADKNGQPATLIIDGDDRADSEAYNVVGKLERGTQWVVVTTPLSG